MWKRLLAPLLIGVLMAYAITVFLYERERNYPEIMAVTGATPLALAEHVPEGPVLTVTGMVKKDYLLSGSALRALATTRIRTKEVSPDGRFLGAYIYQGIPVFHILEGIAPKKPEEIPFQSPVDLVVTFTSDTGRKVSLSYGELLMADDCLPVCLAFHRKPLQPTKDPDTYTRNLYPDNLEGLRLVCPRDPDTSRYLDRVVSIAFGVHQTPDALMPPFRKGQSCRPDELVCLRGEGVRRATFEGVRTEVVRDWVRLGHGHGFMGVSSARGYNLRSFLRRNFPACGKDQDYLFVACDGFRALFSGPEIFLTREGATYLLLTELDGEEAQGKIIIAPMSDYFVDRHIWGISHILAVDRD